MNKKIYVLLILLGCLIFTGCSFKNIKDQNIANTFVLFKSMENTKDSEEQIYDVYIKSDGKEKNKLASNIINPIDVYHYSKNGNIVYLNDKKNNLLKFNVQGENEIVANHITNNSYSISDENKTIIYIDNNNSLYIKEDEGDKNKIASNIIDYKVSKDKKTIYYIDNLNNLYLYNSGNNELLSSNVHNFEISENGEYVVFLKNQDYGIYIKNKKNTESIPIYYSQDLIENLKVNNDGEVMFLDQNYYDEDNSRSKGELYLYNGNKISKIASDVNIYIKKDNVFYFLDADGTLYEKSLKNKKSSQILSDVQDFEIIENGILCIDKNGILYYKEYNKNIQEKATLKNKSPENIKVINNKSFIYITEDNKLFIDDDEIDQNVDSYAFTSEIVSYLKGNEIHTYNLKDNKDTIEIKNVNDYSYIYLENQLLFTNKLDGKKLEGFWEVKPEGNIENSSYILEFNDTNKLIEYRNGMKYTIEYEIEDQSENSMTLITKDDETITVQKVNDNDLIITRNGWDSKATKISKDKINNIVNNESENTKYNINGIDYNAEENINEIIKKYEYNFIDAVNTGDFYKLSEVLVYNSKLYNEQYENIPKFYENGISETLLDYDIKKIKKVNDKEYRVTVYEKIEIRGNKSTTNIKEFKNTYIVVNDDGEFLISEMKLKEI